MMCACTVTISRPILFDSCSRFVALHLDSALHTVLSVGAPSQQNLIGYERFVFVHITSCHRATPFMARKSRSIDSNPTGHGLFAFAACTCPRLFTPIHLIINRNDLSFKPVAGNNWAHRLASAAHHISPCYRGKLNRKCTYLSPVGIAVTSGNLY